MLINYYYPLQCRNFFSLFLQRLLAHIAILCGEWNAAKNWSRQFQMGPKRFYFYREKMHLYSKFFEREKLHQTAAGFYRVFKRSLPYQWLLSPPCPIMSVQYCISDALSDRDRNSIKGWPHSFENFWLNSCEKLWLLCLFSYDKVFLLKFKYMFLKNEEVCPCMIN